MADLDCPLDGKRVFVAGHEGMVGSAIVRALRCRRRCEVLTAPRRSLDLRRPERVESWMRRHRPQAVFLAAARVGGISANQSRPAEFLHDNLAIAASVVEAARKAAVEKLLFLGSSCIYPRLAPQPISETALMTGPLEATNEWYAVAKIAGVKLCDAYRRQYGCNFVSLMPTNLYGPGDNFDPESSHVIPALMRRMHDAKVVKHDSVTVWGSGSPRREFLHVDDLADACVFLMERYAEEGPVNVGSGQELSIAELAGLVKDVVGYQGDIVFDASKPDGTPRKRLDLGRLVGLGWRAHRALKRGLEETYESFLAAGAAVTGG
ncbi:MAG: GDP-L-fucose synthase [Gammaproteobacteria bacterium]|nr:GDP-L-fucose synthase [Gammaproteobacteria bacterium]